MKAIEKIEKELKELRAREEQLCKQWSSLMGGDLEKRMSALFPDGITLEGIFQVSWDELGNRGYGKDWYKKIADYLNTLQRGTWDAQKGEFVGERPLLGLYQTGYNPDTDQVAFSVQMDQNVPLDKQLGLLRILPLVKAHNGWKLFHIFEHSCSEYESYLFRVSEDHRKAEVWTARDLKYATEYKDTRRKPVGVFEGKNAVKAALTFIRQRLPYELVKCSGKDDR